MQSDNSYVIKHVRLPMEPLRDMVLIINIDTRVAK